MNDHNDDIAHDQINNDFKQPRASYTVETSLTNDNENILAYVRNYGDNTHRSEVKEPECIARGRRVGAEIA